MTASTTRNIIQIDLRTHDAGGRHQIGTLAGFGSEQVAGFILECMAGFVGIRSREGKRFDLSNRRMGWDWFEEVTARLPLPLPRITHPWTPRRA